MTSDADKNPQGEETLAERSARLEAEAHNLAARQAANEAAASYESEPETEEEIADALYDSESADGEETYNAAQSAILIKSLQGEVDQLKDQTARALAEAENIRRRSVKEREDASKFAVSGFAKDLLEVADNFARALDAMPTDLIENEPRLKNLVDGIESTQRAMLKTFEKHGIQKIEPLDQPFDANFHEVMFEAAVPGKPAGIIMQVMEAGYILNGRLLRPARVGVTKDDGTGQNPPAGGHIDTSA